jgi:hypothetical protein
MAGRQPPFRLERIEQFCDHVQMLGAFNLRAHERHDVGANRCLDIAEGLAPWSVDAHQDVGAAFANLPGSRRHETPRACLLGLGHAVLKVQDDAVSAMRVRAGDELLAHDRHEQQRAPGRQVGSHLGHHTIPSSRSTESRSAPMPTRARILAVCSPCLGAGQRRAPGVADRRGTTLCTVTHTDLLVEDFDHDLPGCLGLGQRGLVTGHSGSAYPAPTRWRWRRCFCCGLEAWAATLAKQNGLYAKWRDMKHDAKTDGERGKFDGKAAALDVVPHPKQPVQE